MSRACRMHSRQNISIQNFGCKNLRKRPLEKANCRCDDNIKIGLKTFAPRNPDSC
jgi:hypothetical protein